MTEAEWLSCADPADLLNYIGGFRPSERKLRLYVAAGCRRIWHLMRDGRSRTAVEVAEEYADGLSTEEVRNAAYEAADEAVMDLLIEFPRDHLGYSSDYNSPNRSSSAALNAVAESEVFVGPEAELFYLALNPIDAVVLDLRERGESSQTAETAHAIEQAFHLRLLCDIFGNPFRPVTVEPAWLTSDVVTLARQMYESRDFSAMPILADALQDAGCDNGDILAHCRGASQVHVRGCWVVDLLLGKG